MASGLDALVGAATEGMRKTQSAEEMQPKENAEPKPAPAQDGHMSDSAAAPTRERKKGVPWTEDEHRLFLLGLQKLGKGDWRGISRHFVQSRTPTQVASHAQKYFIRQNNMNKRKRRSSLFDIVNEAPEEPAKAGGRVDGVAGGAGGASGIPGGLSMAFASHLGGYNPTGVAPPSTFSAHGANPPGVSVASATRGDKSASTSDIGTAGEAAAATIAALSMAGSPAATAGYRAAAAAAAAPGARGGSFPGVGRAAELDAATKAAQAQAQAAQVNGFAAMMAQMGAMGQMGQMGSFPPPANWMATYHQFLSQMTAAAAAAQPAAGMAANPFAAMPMGAIPAGVTFPPAMMGGMQMPGAVPAFPGSAPGGLFRPTAERAAPGAPASAPPAGSAEEKAAMVTA